MYAGRKVEEADVDDLFEEPLHPYTKGLLGSIPRLNTLTDLGSTGERLEEIAGIVPTLADLPPGCTLAPRCKFADERCLPEHPPYVQKRPGHGMEEKQSEIH